jgi:hypothetical protein
MAQLIVTAEVMNAAMYVGGSPESSIGAPVMAVSVTAEDGSPVTGLGPSNIEAYFLPGAQFNPSFMGVYSIGFKEQLPGVYVFGLHPNAAPNTDDKFIYCVRVKRKGKRGKGTSDQGQALTTLETFT